MTSCEMNITMQRREFLTATSLAAATCFARTLSAAPRKPRHILLSNGWHCVNIGDIAHAPGMIRLIEHYLNGTTVTFWPYRELTASVKSMLLSAFPTLTIIEPGGVEAGRAVGAQLKQAIERADLFILGSGGYHPEPIDVWRAATDKPYGAYGVSFSSASHQDALRDAAFVYLRDSTSLAVLRDAGVNTKELKFTPDSTFGLHLRNDAAADAYLQRVGLSPQKFLCVIPRLRYSPYHLIYGTEPTPRDLERHRINQEYATADHAPLRETIIRWVRETGQGVLACPEMTYQVGLAKEQLVDPLPADVKRRVVWRDSFWLCDEAASVFARATALVSYDCHAPIIALVNGTPAIHVRLPTDTQKSRMFADLGLSDWKRDLTEIDGSQLADLTLSLHARPAEAGQKVKAAMTEARRLQQASLEFIGQIPTAS